ncbi:MAG: hypothetical protein A2Z25_02465 [Planctomycetes bacterium RBG_16_55_9]|nr:MAG: hypothetical protein A2Z25_02465 [Planctomycetes bacterium RBG_16_55_9]
MFPSIREEFHNKDARLALLARADPRHCPAPCVYDFVPPILHRPLVGWFADRASWRALNPDGKTPLSNVEFKGEEERPAKWAPILPATLGPPMGMVSMLWVLDRDGEILVGPEEWERVKHPSIAAGDEVWAAGEIGFLNGKVRVVDLHSGHYMGRDPCIGWRDSRAEFVPEVFRAYNQTFMNGQGLDETFLFYEW